MQAVCPIDIGHEIFVTYSPQSKYLAKLHNSPHHEVCELPDDDQQAIGFTAHPTSGLKVPPNLHLPVRLGTKEVATTHHEPDEAEKSDDIEDL